MGLPEVEAGVAPATGGAESFEAFYVREYPAVVRLAYALSGSRLVAEDIDQDAFLRAFHDWQRIRRPSAWVRKVAVRRAGRTVQRRLLEARALARLVAGRARPWPSCPSRTPRCGGRSGPCRDGRRR